MGRGITNKMQINTCYVNCAGLSAAIIEKNNFGKAVNPKDIKNI